MNIISQVAKGMQDVLTYAAEIIGSQTGFIQRLRKLMFVRCAHKSYY